MIPTYGAPPKPDEVAITIDGKEWRYWSSLELELAIDSFSTARFSAPFEADRIEFREAFRPFSFKPLTITVGGETLFTGTLVNVTPFVSAEERSVEVQAYSLPGVLADCTLPASLLPFEFKSIGLRTIAETTAGAFGLSVDFAGSPGAEFERVEIEHDRDVYSFLVELANQRGLVVGDDSSGRVVFRNSSPVGRPVARFTDDNGPTTALSCEFFPQQYYSEITCYAPAKRGRVGSKYTQRNRLLSGVTRPNGLVLDDQEKGDVPAATKARLGRMFGNSVSYAVEVPTWFDAQGDLWAPNTTVSLNAPDLMVYTETELLVRTVSLYVDASSRTAAIGLVLPGAFSGEPPESFPWDESPKFSLLSALS